jgi:uncharacterized membrane protein
MKRLGKYFFEGLLVLVPVLGSIYIIYLVFQKIDGILKIPIPGVGFVITIAVITIIGFLSSNFITRRLVRFSERIFSRLPLVKLVYSSIKDLIGAFVGDKKSFDKPVLVTLDNTTKEKALGFITRESLDFLSLSDHVAVYFPQSYNFAGNMSIFPKAQVKHVETKSADVMKFLVSGGLSGGN